MRHALLLIAVPLLVAALLQAIDADEKKGTKASSPYAQWKNGPPHGKEFFMIGVWLQSPRKAEQYRKAGFNTYIGLWKGPTEEQLSELMKAGMKVVCYQNEVGLKHIDDPLIVGWMHGDEPDNAQAKAEGKGYDPPILPKKIVEGYEKMKKADPSRPVLLNLGQGVAWDAWHGRGVRTNHPEDYPEYLKGCDIASFDIYPVVHSKPEVAGKLWYVAKGVERLVKWTDGKKPVWNCIECTHINSAEKKATPHQVKAEVWMSIIHGSVGLIYFVHEWKPKFNESAILDDKEMLAAITALNRQIAELAPVLNSPTSEGKLQVSSGEKELPIVAMHKTYEGDTYVFAVNMRENKTQGTFSLRGLSGKKKIEVVGEDRKLDCRNGRFKDDFDGWDVHLYKLPGG